MYSRNRMYGTFICLPIYQDYDHIVMVAHTHTHTHTHTHCVCPPHPYSHPPITHTHPPPTIYPPPPCTHTASLSFNSSPLRYRDPFVSSDLEGAGICHHPDFKWVKSNTSVYMCAIMKFVGMETTRHNP